MEGATAPKRSVTTATTTTNATTGSGSDDEAIPESDHGGVCFLFFFFFVLGSVVGGLVSDTCLVVKEYGMETVKGRIVSVTIHNALVMLEYLPQFRTSGNQSLYLPHILWPCETYMAPYILIDKIRQNLADLWLLITFGSMFLRRLQFSSNGWTHGSTCVST